MQRIITGALALFLSSGAAFAQSPYPFRPEALALSTGVKTATATAGAATLNKPAGKVTTEALVTAALSNYTLTLTNSTIAATDNVFVSLAYGTANAGNPVVSRVTPGAGSVTITVRNVDPTVALNGSLIVSFFTLRN